MLTLVLDRAVQRAEDLNRQLYRFLRQELPRYHTRVSAFGLLGKMDDVPVCSFQGPLDIRPDLTIPAVNPEPVDCQALTKSLNVHLELNKIFINRVHQCEEALAQDYLTGRSIPEMLAEKIDAGFMDHCDFDPLSELPITDLCEVLARFYNFKHDAQIQHVLRNMNKFAAGGSSKKRKRDDGDDDEDDDDEDDVRRAKMQKLIDDIPAPDAPNY